MKKRATENTTARMVRGGMVAYRAGGIPPALYGNLQRARTNKLVREVNLHGAFHLHTQSTGCVDHHKDGSITFTVPSDNTAHGRVIRMHEALHATMSGPERKTGMQRDDTGQALEDCRIHMAMRGRTRGMARDEIAVALRELRAAAAFRAQGRITNKSVHHGWGCVVLRAMGLLRAVWTDKQCTVNERRRASNIWHGVEPMLGLSRREWGALSGCIGQIDEASDATRTQLHGGQSRSCQYDQAKVIREKMQAARDAFLDMFNPPQPKTNPPPKGKEGEAAMTEHAPEEAASALKDWMDQPDDGKGDVRSGRGTGRASMTVVDFTNATATRRCADTPVLSRASSGVVLRGGSLVGWFMGTIARPFRVTRHRPEGGVILLDCSGSMHPQTELLHAIAQRAPAATIAGYCGGSDSAASGILGIFAKRGRVINSLDAFENHPLSGGGNCVDGEAIEWLLRQPDKNKILVTDQLYCSATKDDTRKAHKLTAWGICSGQFIVLGSHNALAEHYGITTITEEN